MPFTQLPNEGNAGTLQETHKCLRKGGEYTADYMGLDMYLRKSIYVWQDERGSLTIRGLRHKIDPDKVSYIVEEAGYWRKANAIHTWFVQNVQDGHDDCREHYVTRETLASLLAAVTKVLDASELVDGTVANGSPFDAQGNRINYLVDGKVIKDPSVAKELLPTEDGFFFGSTDYDQYYIEDLQNTKKILEKAISDREGDYYYQSSW
jgi:hypothetical protein